MARRLEVVIVGDTRDLERALGRAGKASKSMGDRVRTGAKVAGFALAGVLAVGARAGIKELMETQKVAAQTNAVLKSTGGVANVTAEEITGLAGELSRMSGIDDELIQSGENLLLTFKNIKNGTSAGTDTFNRATAAALDLSVALGKDMNSSVLMLGKSLNDPIKGMTALGRAGVQFTDSQKKTIKMLVESNRLFEAQQLILSEVESQVGGSAKAYGETLPGQLGKAQIAYEEMTASIMLMLLPAITAVTKVATRWAEFMQKHPGLAKVMTGSLIVLAAAFIAVGVASGAATIAASPWIAAVVGMAVVVGALVVALRSTSTWIHTVGLRALAAISPIAALALAIKRHSGSMVAAFHAVSSAISTISNAIITAIGWIRDLIGWISRIPSLPFSGGGGVQPNYGPGAGQGGRGADPRVQRSGMGRAGATMNFYGSVISTDDVARQVQRRGLQAAFREGIV